MLVKIISFIIGIFIGILLGLLLYSPDIRMYDLAKRSYILGCLQEARRTCSSEEKFSRRIEICKEASEEYIKNLRRFLGD